MASFLGRTMIAEMAVGAVGPPTGEPPVGVGNVTRTAQPAHRWIDTA
jgi:hypothetical protein